MAGDSLGAAVDLIGSRRIYVRRLKLPLGVCGGAGDIYVLMTCRSEERECWVEGMKVERLKVLEMREASEARVSAGYL